MTQLRWLLHTAASGLASLGCAAAVAGGFQWVAGQPDALPLHPLPIELPAGRMQPWPSHSLLHNGGQPPLIGSQQAWVCSAWASKTTPGRSVAC